jgi:O-antigen/teichoic acid export membrane protein
MSKADRTDSESFIGHAVQTGLVRVLTTAIGFGATIINARWLGVEGVGVLALLLLLTDFSFRYGHLGFGSSFAYFVARGEDTGRRCLRIAIPVTLASSVICVITILALWRLDFSPWQHISTDLLYLCLPGIPLLMLLNFLQRILSGELLIEKINIGNVLKTVVYVLLLIALVIHLELGIAGALLATIVSDLIVCVYLIVELRRSEQWAAASTEGPIDAVPGILKFWRYGRWNYVLMLLGFFTENLPMILLQSLTMDHHGVGLFSRARALGKLLRSVVQPFSQVLFPYTAASGSGEATRRTSALCRNTLMILLPVVIVLSLFIEQIIRLVYGVEFVPAAMIFYALTPGILIWPIDYFLGVHLAASGRPAMVLATSVFSVTAAALISYFLIPIYGAVGAGMSFSIIFVLETFCRTWTYTHQTEATWSEVILPQRSDLAHYRRLLGMITRR